QLRVALVDRRPVRAVQLDGGDVAPLEHSGRVLRGQAQRLDHTSPLPNPLGGCKSAPTGTLTSDAGRRGDTFAPEAGLFAGRPTDSPGGDPEQVALAVGSVCKGLLDRKRRPRLVVGPSVDEVEGVRRRLDVRQIELGDLADRFENRVQLLAKA